MGKQLAEAEMLAALDNDEKGIDKMKNEKETAKNMSFDGDMTQLKNILIEKRPKTWSQLPDIELYMDQVLSYMVRQHVGPENEELLTAAMVNNYIKKGLLPRAKGKKYDREHIAYLTAICLLKQVISVSDAGAMLEAELENQTIEEFYRKYCDVVDKECTTIHQKIDDKMSSEDTLQLVLELAISSYVQKLACEEIIKKNFLTLEEK